MKVRQMPFYETDAQGQKVKRMSSKWYAVFVDWSDALRRLPLLEDRKASTELARKIDRLNSIRAGGDMMTADLTRYVETMPPGIRGKLAEWGILSAVRWQRANRWPNIWPIGKLRRWPRGTPTAMPSLSQAAPARRSMPVALSCGVTFPPASCNLTLRVCGRIGAKPTTPLSG